LVKQIAKNEFGSFTMIMSTAIMLGSISDFGMGGLATRFISEFKNNEKQRAGQILRLSIFYSLFISIFLAIVYLFLSQYLNRLFFGNNSFKNEIMISSLVIILFSLNTTLVGILVGLGKFTNLAITGLIGGSLYLVIPIMLLNIFGIRGAICGIALSYLIQVLFMFGMIRNTDIYKFPQIDKFSFFQERHFILKYSIPSISGGLLATFGLWSLQYNILRTTQNTGLIADFNIANNIKTIVLIIPAVISGVSMNLLNSINALNTSKYKDVFKFSKSITFITTLILATIFYVFSKEILFLFGKQYQSNYLILGILLLATIPETITMSFSQILITENKLWKSFFLINLPRDGFVFIFLGTILINKYGIAGACYTYLLARIYSMVVVFFLTKKSKLML
jgi:O-antigen/teichoic acid export membrane protein